MRKADRLFQVVHLIGTHQPITAMRLAEQLCVSVRTIYRYIDDLSLSGIPIYGEPGIGYSVHRDFYLPPLALTEEEAEALTLAVNLLSRSVGSEMGEFARSLLAKINAVLPTTVDKPASSNIISLANPYSAQQMRYWDQLRRGIVAKHSLIIEYLSLTGDFSRREIYPLGLFYWGGKWTVGAWCTLREDYRDFRVDLIKKLEYSPVLGMRPPHASLESFMAHHVVDLPLTVRCQ